MLTREAPIIISAWSISLKGSIGKLYQFEFEAGIAQRNVSPQAAKEISQHASRGPRGEEMGGCTHSSPCSSAANVSICALGTGHTFTPFLVLDISDIGDVLEGVRAL